MGALLVSRAQAEEGRFSYSGFARTQAAYSLKHDNPNNRALGLPADQDFNLIKAFLVTDLEYNQPFEAGAPVDNVRLFTRWRINKDLTEDWSGGIGDYNAFPLSYRNDGTLARAESESTAFELWEAFADIRAGRNSVRIGRQNIVWGEADALRLLDVVNPLDLTQHMFFEAGGEQFDHIRIPVWALRWQYEFAKLPGYSVDAFVIPGDYVPTALPDRGSPFNQLPFPSNSAPTFLPGAPFLIPGIRVDDNLDARRDDWEGGVRLLGDINGFQYTLNYMSKIDQDGITTLSSRFPGGFDPTTLQVVMDNHRKRLDIYGASFNWVWPKVGGVLRGELSYTPDQPYAGPLVPQPGGPPLPVTRVERDTVKWVLGFDRPTFVFPTEQTMSISLQWFQTRREGNEDGITILNGRADKNETNFSVFLSQPIMNSQISFDFLAVVDTDDAYWWQPQVRFLPGDHWRVALYANLFTGSETRPGRFGAMSWANEINMAVTYQF
jgi:hypothetical protein